MVIRFVDENVTVHEEFLGFCECTSNVTGEALADEILFKKLEKDWELNMDYFVDKDMTVMVPWLEREEVLQHE